MSNAQLAQARKCVLRTLIVLADVEAVYHVCPACMTTAWVI